MKRLLRLSLFLLLLFIPFLQAEGEVVINEVLALNGVYVWGEAPDWVELYNKGDQSLSLSGWSLKQANDKGEPFIFPDKALIKPRGYALVYCTGGKAYVGAEKGSFTAPFKLSGKGESLLLCSPDGKTADSLSFTEQFGNISWGRPQNTGDFAYLDTPSSLSSNSAQGYPGRALMPVQTPGGYYPEGLQVSLSAEPSAQIRYTLNGSEPTEMSKLYTGPLQIKKTTVLRSRAFVKGLLPSQSACATYFKEEPNGYARVSLVTDVKYLFDPKTGAMVKGKGATPNYEREWEYPTNIEYFNDTGLPEIDQMGTFTMSGHSARINPQKSIALYARSAYGEDRFSFNPFPLRSYTSYKSLLLRSTNSDAYSTRLRDPFISSLSQGMDLLYQDARPIEVFINGEYWGHYNLREKINKYFVAQWEGVTKDKEIDKIDILARTGADQFVQNGDNKDWLALMDFCESHDLNRPENLKYVEDRLDIDNFFRHSIFEMIIGNYDMTNVRMYRVPGGKWKYLLFDVEAGFMGLKEEPVSFYLKGREDKRARFQHIHLAALLEVPQMRERFLTLFAQTLENQFYWPKVKEKLEAWDRVLQPLLPRHIRRFPGMSLKAQAQNVKAVAYYAKVRPLKVINFVSAKMKLTPSEEERFFGETRKLLKEGMGK